MTPGKQKAMGQVPAGTWRPAGKRVMILPSEEYKRDGELGVTNHGIVLPPTVLAGRPAISGVVVAVGPDVKLYKVYDVVMYVAYQGATVKIGSTSYLMMEEDDVMAVFEGDPDKAPLPGGATLSHAGTAVERRNGRARAKVHA